MSLAGLLQAHEEVTRPISDCRRIDSAYESQRKAPKWQKPRVIIRPDSVERESTSHKGPEPLPVTDITSLKAIVRTRTLCAVLPNGETIELHSGSLEALKPLVKSAEQALIAYRHRLPVRDGFPVCIIALAMQHGTDIEFSILG